MTPAERSTPTNDPRDFRRALGRFPTGVAFVSARDADGRPVGVLANSFTSVSLDPPMVLWCLGLTSRARETFARGGAFAISLLTQTQRDLIADLSRPPEVRFDGVTLAEGFEGCPLLSDAAASFECSTHSITRAGDHEVIVGLVKRFEDRDHEPLAFLGGRYGRVHHHPA